MKSKSPKARPSKESIQNQHLNLKHIEPLTDNQELTFEEYDKGNHLVLTGSAGSGKSFLALYLALDDLMRTDAPYDKIIIIRSAVPSRDMGFVPGTLEEKAKIYQEPYIDIVNQLMGRGDAWSILSQKKIIHFQTTSFLRGLSFDNSIVIFDEFQSATFPEIDTVMTRIGNNCRFILCGDFYQSDLNSKKESSGFNEVMKILNNINGISTIRFTPNDVVRSGFVKEYLLQKEKILHPMKATITY